MSDTSDEHRRLYAEFAEIQQELNDLRPPVTGLLARDDDASPMLREDKIGHVTELISEAQHRWRRYMEAVRVE